MNTDSRGPYPHQSFSLSGKVRNEINEQYGELKMFKSSFNGGCNWGLGCREASLKKWCVIWHMHGRIGNEEKGSKWVSSKRSPHFYLYLFSTFPFPSDPCKTLTAQTVSLRKHFLRLEHTMCRLYHSWEDICVNSYTYASELPNQHSFSRLLSACRYDKEEAIPVLLKDKPKQMFQKFIGQ